LLVGGVPDVKIQDVVVCKDNIQMTCLDPYSPDEPDISCANNMILL